MSRMWSYTLCLLALWVIDPELRRLYDWQFGFSQIEPISALPLVGLLPHVWSLTIGGGWARLPRPLAIAAWFWLGGFTYALVLAVLNDNLAPGLYAFANFVLPIGVGLWMAADSAGPALSYRRVTRVLFVLTTAISIYGIVQFIFLPQWDALWLRSVTSLGATSFGKPYPFEVRVFSMLNAPGPFGNFLALLLLMSLPHLSPRRPWLLAQVPIWLIAFGLSQDRSGWLLFAIGTVVYLAFTPQRRELIVTLLVCAPLLVASGWLVPALVGNDVIVSQTLNRIGTLADLETDRSANDRQALYREGIDEIIAAPFGHGLGVVGTSTKLSESNWTTDIDSGILARFIEMGFPGVLLYVGGFLILVFGSITSWRRNRIRDPALQRFIAMTLALEIGLLCLEIAGDLGGLLVLVLWLFGSFALSAKTQTDRGLTRVDLRATPPFRTAWPRRDLKEA